MSRYYRRVELDANGDTVEPVSLVAVYPLRWGKSRPDCALVETDGVDDLLRACKALISWYTLPDRCKTAANSGALGQVIDMANAAIRKAKGIDANTNL